MNEKFASYKVAWSSKEIESLREKIRGFRLPLQPSDSGWKYGSDPQFLNELRNFWADGYDFEEAQRYLNTYPQFIGEVEPNVDLHFVHVIGDSQGKRPLLLAHGWPSSILEFWKIIEPLCFPSKFGGSSDDAFDIVIPTLPGFGASYKPKAPIASDETARWYNMLMQQLGYKQYYVHGADIGSDVAWHMASAFPDALIGLRLNDVKPNKTISVWPSEFKWLYDSNKANKKLGAYYQLQNTRPESLAFAMVDNPVGQLAWIVERFHDWADLRARSFEQVFTKTELLNNVMIYFMTDSFTTSTWFYYARAQRGTIDRKIEVRTGISPFPDQRTPPLPKSYAARNFELVYWKNPKSGGHFAALEEPEEFVTILREWAKVVGK